MNDMTVLYVLDYGTKGGATIAFIDMVNQMKENGVTPIVVTGKRTGLNDMLEARGITTVAAGHYTLLESFSFTHWFWPYSYIKRFLRYWINERKALKILERKIEFANIDLIHTNSARNSIGCRLSKKYNTPHVMHIREFADKDFNCVSFMPGYIRFFNKNTNAFVSISGAVMNHWNKKGIDKNKNHLIYDGVNYRDITVSERNKRSVQLKMVITGGVYPTKGQHLAVEAIGMLAPEIRDHVTLDIIGWYNNKYHQELNNYASSRGYGDKIRFLGAVDDVHQRLCNYDIGLMCSRSEGFGLVTAEYMHAGLGVIASNTGACPEIVEDKKTGLLFSSGDSDDLARCISLFYRDRVLLVDCAKNAKVKAQTCFTDEINSKKIRKMYSEVINSEM